MFQKEHCCFQKNIVVSKRTLLLRKVVCCRFLCEFHTGCFKNAQAMNKTSKKATTMSTGALQLAHVTQGPSLQKSTVEAPAWQGCYDGVFPSQIESRLSSQTQKAKIWKPWFKSKTEMLFWASDRSDRFCRESSLGHSDLASCLGWSTYCRYRNSGEVAWSHHHRRANP